MIRKLIIIIVHAMALSLLSCSKTENSASAFGGKEFTLPLGPHAMKLYDPENELKLEEVMKLPKKYFQENGNRQYILAGMQRGRVWVRVQLAESLLPSGPFVIEFNQPSVNMYELYFMDKKDGRYLSIKTGLLAEYSEHRFLSRMHALVLPETIDFSSPLYIRVENENDINFRPTLYNQAAFQRQVQIESHFFGAIVGLLLSMLVYNLFIYVSLKETSYLYYVLYLVATTFYVFPIWGVLIALFPEYVHLQREMMWISLGLVTSTASLFSREFLQIKKTSVFLDRLLMYFIFSGFILIFLGVAKYFYIASILSKINGLSLTAVIIISGFVSYREGNKSAKYFIAGWSILMSSYIILTLKTIGVISENLFSPKTTPFATGLEAVLLSLALADRIKVLNAQKESALARATQYEEFKRMSEELSKANDTKNTLFSLLAHDLRGPIGNLSILLKMARDREVSVSERLLEQLSAGAQNVYNLLENLLTWARSQKGEIEFRPKRFNVGKTARKSAILYLGQANEKRVALKIEKGDVIYGFADPELVGTVIRNFVSNAVKFTPSGGIVTVKTEKKEGFARISVTDTGTGFSEEKGKTLLKPGEKVSSTPGTGREKGSGMGLVLCREFIDMNGGQAGFTSVPGKGSEFWFTIPLAGADSAEAAGETGQKQGDWSGLRVLLVEDDPLNLGSHQLILKQMGITPDVAASSAGAVEAAGSTDFDLVLMDVNLPDMNGAETVRIIRGKPDNKSLFVALTSYTKNELVEMGLDVFDGYLEKPLESEKLAELLSKELPAS